MKLKAYIGRQLVEPRFIREVSINPAAGTLERQVSGLTDSSPDLCKLEAMDGDAQATSERILLEPYKYLLQLPGKQVRTKLSQAFNHWLNVPEDKLQVVIEVTEMLHNASLLIDDIEDSSTLRRGFPVAHSIYGIPSVINSANYVYFLGLEKVLTMEHPEAVRVFTRQLLELHRESTQVQNILRQRTENMDIKRYCVDYLEKVGSFAYTRQTLRDLEVEAYRLIREFGGNPQLESLVKHLSQIYREPEDTAESSTESTVQPNQ
ncbi:Geranylgeranyl pyrophosphate synthase [Larimichthys crocea]|uniref:Geranylgeranyl pyrophosphate synthase n=1 Tax=Larimichthys crocea TaxID=215358 RepID=A0A6G0HN26_LARCR|nr:Geranylgeranyl pyrophosphate synthase [Larimichthys crocea]